MSALRNLLCVIDRLPGPGLSLMDQSIVGLDEAVRQALSPLYEMVNGGYAFDGALHIFPAHSAEQMDLARWNAMETWRCEYGDLADGLTYFAEDVFGVQFAIGPDGICVFDYETGRREPCASNIHEWAGRIMDDSNVLTGQSIARAWQALHGEIPAGKRLYPKRPFMAGGAYSLENLYAGESIEAMRFRGYVAQQIRDLPEGTAFTFKVVE